MKIKKFFGLVSIASLAVLMSACGNKKKNETVFDSKFFSQLDQDIADYKEENASKKKAVTVFENETIYANSGSIYITEDLNNYYIYNLELDDKKIITLEKSDIDGININTQYSLIVVSYNKNANGYYGYEAYLFNGKQVLEKAYCLYDLSISSSGTSSYSISQFESYRVKGFTLNCSPEDIGYRSIKYYEVTHSVTDSGIGNSKTQTKDYYPEGEYLDKFGNIENFEADGKIYGLKGYTIKKQGNTYILFKNGKFVNKITLNEDANVIVSNGYALVQTARIVSNTDDYDVCFGGEYIKVSTYKICLKNSKITELKNFHYIFEPVFVSYNDGVIDYWGCQVLDFKAHKQATANDLTIALLKGNGKIEVNESINFNGSLVLSENDTYYTYVVGASHSSASEQTVVYNKKGDVVGAYNGIYYDGITTTLNNETAKFIDKDGNVKAILNSCTRINFGLYVGKDILGNNALVEIKDGNAVIVDTHDYYYRNEFYTKINGSTLEFYTADSTLTQIDYNVQTSSNFDYKTTVNGTRYYLAESASGSTLVYFE